MSPGLMGTLARAAEYAQAQHHGEVALEHLLLALTEDGDATPVLAASHVDLALLTADVSQYLGGMEPHAPAGGDGQLGISAELKRILEAAAAAASQGRRREINGAIVLAAIVGDGRSSAAHMLRGQGLTFEEAIKALQRAMAAPIATVAPVAPVQARPAATMPMIPVDSEDILATARQRVQSRSAPGLPPAPVRSEPAQVVLPPALPVPLKPPAEVAAQFREAMSAEIDANRDDRAFGYGDDQRPDAGHATQHDGNHHDNYDTGVDGYDVTQPQQYQQGPGDERGHLSLPPEAYDPSAYGEARFEPIEVPPGAITAPPPVPTVGQQRPPQLPPQLPPVHPVWPDAIPGGAARPVVPAAVSGQRWPAPVEPAWREQPPAQPHGYRPTSEGAETVVLPPLPPPMTPPLPPALPPSLPPLAPYTGDRPNWAGEEPLPRAMPRLADRDVGTSSQPAPLARPPPLVPAGFGEPQPLFPPVAAAPSPAKARGKPKTTAIANGHMVENVPRRMRAYTPVNVEVRLAKSELRGLVDGLHGGGQAYGHAMLVAPAMSVRLRAPDGGFTIEAVSPETQWVETRLGLIEADFANWRWTVTPQKAGKRRLQLVVAARTFGGDGMAADTALPDQIVDVSVVTNYGRVATQAASWIAIAIAGGMLATFGKVFADPVIAAVLAALK